MTQALLIIPSQVYIELKKFAVLSFKLPICKSLFYFQEFMEDSYWRNYVDLEENNKIDVGSTMIDDNVEKRGKIRAQKLKIAFFLQKTFHSVYHKSCFNYAD